MTQAGIHLQIPSTVFFIEPVRVFIGKLAQGLGFSQKRVADIQLVLDEICSNAVHHGSANAAAGVELHISMHAGVLEILVRDAGAQDPAAESWLTPERLLEIERDRSPRNERGHGIFIVKSLADVHEMKPNAVGGTDVRVAFRFPKPLICP